MTILKKSQITLLSITLMLVIAGYINYKYNPDREKNLGQTIYVNNKDGFTYDNVSIYSDKDDKKTTDALQDETKVNSTVDTSKVEDSIAVFKYDRDNMFSELSENYREVIANSNTTKEKINEYQTKLNDLISKKNLITMVENVIKSRGIEDIVIIPTNNDNLTVVVKSKEDLKPEQVAQIQQILQDQFAVSADKISISVDKK
ncbi:MAG: SpoIIIAH-like family protein [Clostridia bacterium]|nr:SpoIIIAH-like family protein [Clostridia bacterium]